TTFNGKNVPEVTSLDGATLNDAIKGGYWLVEFFSPYCGHCKQFAPTWQTLYEFYYTQDPLPQTSGSGESESDLNSFTRYYNFKFAKVDCIANGDTCAENKITSFPTVVLFKDGEQVKTCKGAKDMKEMSKWVEEILESIKPGSRPKDGLILPKAGDHEVEKTLMPEQPPVPLDGNAGSRVTPTASASKSTISATRVPELPNQAGKSVPLTAESFQRLVTTTRNPWFVKFYAPWCHHCQAMAPNWQGMARQMQNRMNVGEVNCDVEKRLCKDVKVHGYPTILFFRGGERIEYDGLRGLGDLIDFAKKAEVVGDGIKNVTAADFEEMEKKEEVIFLYLYDHATTHEDFQALDRLTMSLIGHAKLVTSKDPALNERFKISTWPRLLVSRDGKPTYYTALSPRDMRDYRRVLNWMQTVWLPIVPELTASNAQEVMKGRLVVLGILSRDRPEEFVSAKREIKNAALEWIDKQTQAFQLERQELRDAKQLRIEEAEDRNDQRGLRAAKSIRINMDDIERKEVGFAWVDGIFWERWIRTTFGISVQSDNERVVMYDYDNHRYWDVTMTGNPIVPSRTSILETLPRVVSSPPKLSPKSTTTALGHVWWVVKGQVFEHPLVSTAIAIVTIMGAVILGRRHLRLGGGVSSGYFKVGEKNGMDGLLGGNSGGQGKVD
ncbi:thioredoxin-like protein, partial [Teratosphaeria nubilosa]